MDALFFLRFFSLSLAEPGRWPSRFEGETARYLMLPSSDESLLKFRFVLDAQPFLGLLFVNKPAIVPRTPCFRFPSLSGLCFVTGEPFGSAGFSVILIVLTSGRRFGLVFRFFGSSVGVNRSFSTTAKGPWSSLLESSSAGGWEGASVPVGIVWSEMECAGGIASEYGCRGLGMGCPASEVLRSDCPGGSTRAIWEAEWEGRMEERSECSSPGSGKGLDAGRNIGEFGGETRPAVEMDVIKPIIATHSGRLS